MAACRGRRPLRRAGPAATSAGSQRCARAVADHARRGGGARYGRRQPAQARLGGAGRSEPVEPVRRGRRPRELRSRHARSAAEPRPRPAVPGCRLCASGACAGARGGHSTALGGVPAWWARIAARSSSANRPATAAAPSARSTRRRRAAWPARRPRPSWRRTPVGARAPAASTSHCVGARAEGEERRLLGRCVAAGAGGPARRGGRGRVVLALGCAGRPGVERAWRATSRGAVRGRRRDDHQLVAVEPRPRPGCRPAGGAPSSARRPTEIVDCQSPAGSAERDREAAAPAAGASRARSSASSSTGARPGRPGAARALTCSQNSRTPPPARRSARTRRSRFAAGRHQVGLGDPHRRLRAALGLRVGRHAGRDRHPVVARRPRRSPGCAPRSRRRARP